MTAEVYDHSRAKEDRRNEGLELPRLNGGCDAAKGWHASNCWDESLPCPHVFAARYRTV